MIRRESYDEEVTETMSDTQWQERIAALEAKDEVRELVARYCSLNDALTRLDELVGLFTDDAVMVNAAGDHVGRAAIDAYYRAFFDGSTEFARHHTMNQVIDILEPGVARHRSYFIAFLGRQGDSKIAFGEYDDVLVKTAEGWRFSRKGNHVVGITTPESGWARGFAEAVR